MSKWVETQSYPYQIVRELGNGTYEFYSVETEGIFWPELNFVCHGTADVKDMDTAVLAEAYGLAEEELQDRTLLAAKHFDMHANSYLTDLKAYSYDEAFEKVRRMAGAVEANMNSHYSEIREKIENLVNLSFDDGYWEGWDQGREALLEEGAFESNS